jgi:ATP-dependent Lon protease
LHSFLPLLYRCLTDPSLTQLEWVTTIPWPSSSPSPESINAIRDPAFLSKAKAQLDADHFGLEKIKRRLIEYLAVIRLKYLALDAKQAGQENTPKTTARVDAEAREVIEGGEDAVKQIDAVNQPRPRAMPGWQLDLSRKRRVKGPILLYLHVFVL